MKRLIYLEIEGFFVCAKRRNENDENVISDVER
jgi:hypothetical protein